MCIRSEAELSDLVKPGSGIIPDLTIIKIRYLTAVILSKIIYIIHIPGDDEGYVVPVFKICNFLLSKDHSFQYQEIYCPTGKHRKLT